MSRADLKSMTLPELTAWLQLLGEPAFRARQVYKWLHQKNCASFDEMSDLSVALRQKLREFSYINSVSIKKKLVSQVDGTVKYLYELRDGNCVEAVLMHHHHGQSLCVSTQVGCRMGCRFCASTLGGLVRGLTPAEMLDEVYQAERDSGEKISNLVLMGIGEPLDNYENVLSFLRILSSPEGQNLSLRHVSLSTCGLADKIRLLAEERLGLTLSVSLHAPNDEIRSQTMPVNARWPIAELMEACRFYFGRTGRRVSFEYALIQGVNDHPAHAGELAGLLRGFPAHVNLIPVNPVAETGYRRTVAEGVRRFQGELVRLGINATVRRELGTDIAAACGQLRREEAAAGARVSEA